jgi:RNA polymerase sigma-70 factor (ECF subfamily)
VSIFLKIPWEILEKYHLSNVLFVCPTLWNAFSTTTDGDSFSMLGSGAAAEDVVQDAFLKLLSEKPFPDSPKAWLYRVVRNGAIDRKRRESRYRNISERLDDWFEPVADEPFDGEALTTALESLDGDLREIIVAKIWSGLTFREIAELTERPISSVHLDYQRGIETLRKLLERK